ncbi:MAG: hypothetical protein HZC47_04720 [Methanobacterium sp.]|uniref:hypothetical protein n=1 Tax=Methanobacterium sp. TaxID=2164 RepID=UPI003D65E76C|nr:hypothetical protein [Methanobacterium sp.]
MNMNPIIFGVIAGLIFGIISVLIMIPIKFEDQRERRDAMAGAFIDRFMIGFIIPNMAIGINPIIIGALIGLGLSLPSAIISRTYAPILIIGILGGVVIGYLTGVMI